MTIVAERVPPPENATPSDGPSGRKSVSGKHGTPVVRQPVVGIGQ
jgi:hypothetical protein